MAKNGVRWWAVCASLLAAGCRPEAPADVAVISGRVLTVDRDFSRAEAVAIRNGVFVAVGSNDEVTPYIGSTTRVIDAEGRTVIPGLIETHVHATWAARAEVQRPFIQLGSIAEIQDWLRQEVARTPPGQWIRVPRVDMTRIRERRMPTRQELDEAAPDRPALFNWEYADRQVQVLNSAALRAAGITRQTEAPPGGTIHRDADGEPTGVLEQSGQLVSKFMPEREISEAEYLDSLERLLRTYNSLGITSIGERRSSAEDYRTYETLKAAGRLSARVTVTIGIGYDGPIQDVEQTIRDIPFKPGEGDDWLKIGPLKVRVDGGVHYGTAYLREPYGPGAFSLYGFDDPAYRGTLQITPEQLETIIRTGHRLGWQMATHVTGDAGVDEVLDAVEAANADSPIGGRRFTLIHAYFPNPAAARRAARLGVGVDAQPILYYKDGDALADALGPRRVQAFIGLQTWRRAGVHVAINADHMRGFGPDTALNPFNPFLTMYVAHTRKTEAGRVMGPEQRVSREDALRMMTVDAAWLSFDDASRGSIEVGKLGDLAILSDHLLTCDEARIPDIRSVLTIVGGRIVHTELDANTTS